MLGRLKDFWIKHRTLFWTIHSIWAFAAGVAVLVIARERYEYVPWVIAFLVLTWLSTLYFGRTISSKPAADEHDVPGLKREVVSYLTRAMYQQTLFFLLPFYWYSTVVSSLNVFLLVVLTGLAVFSCVELVFDRWLRRKPIFGLVFFATVSFAAVNLLIPLLVPISPTYSTPVAAVLAVASAIPLAFRRVAAGWSQKLRFGLVCLLLLAIGIGLPDLVPPVPLRLQQAVFTTNIDRSTLAPADTLGPSIDSSDLGRSLFVLTTVFAPSNVPSRASIEWRRNDEVFRKSREVEIVAHNLGFRLWDGFRLESGRVRPGGYEIVLRTGEGRVFGRARLEIR